MQTLVPPRGEHILVVDDSRETVRHLAETVLPRFGFKSSYALDGRTALQKIRQETPDLVMLDLNLPEMTGIDVLEALALENYQPPVVLMTGGGSENSAVNAFRLGVRDYLVKPFTVDEVVETIRRTLDGHGRVQDSSADHQQLNAAQNEIRRQKEQFRQLLQISKNITSLGDLNTIVDRVLRVTLEQCHAEQSLLWLPNIERTQLTTYQHLLESGAVFTHNTPVQNQYLSKLFQTGAIIRETNFSDGLDVGMERPARAIMYAPLRIHNEVVGAIGVGNLHAPHAFSELDEMFVVAISEYCSIALTNAFALQRTRSTHANRIRDLYNLVTITNALVTHPPQKVIQDALFHAFNRWQIEACSVWLVDRPKKNVRFFTNMGMGTEELQNMSLPFGEGFVGYVAETGKWIYSNAVMHHPRHHAEIDQQTGFQTRSLLCVPLTYQGRVLGALQLLNRMDGEFNEKDVEQAMSVAAVITIAIYHMQVEKARFTE